ncbi:MAG: hypothetical protein RBT76_09920 [candidate division Zixibacteria bacterium]|nr:hypothetical protein [candidate division Zixibacteria bacterium]
MTEEYRTIIDWCLVVLDFLARRTPGEHRSIYQSGEKDLVETFERGGLRGLKMAYRETLVMAKQLPPADQVKLDELLRRKFGSGLDEVFAESDRKADKILKRGKIKNEDEFYFLRECFESIWEASRTLDIAAHFTGSFKVNVSVVNGGRSLRFELTNPTSLTSFGYQSMPSYERHSWIPTPMGTTRQTITWTEPILGR